MLTPKEIAIILIAGPDRARDRLIRVLSTRKGGSPC